MMTPDEPPAPEDAAGKKPKRKKSLEETAAELERLHDAMMDDEARNQRVYDDVEAALGRIARKHFPHLGNWDPDLLRKLATVISRAAWSYFENLDELEYEHEQRAAGKPPQKV